MQLYYSLCYLTKPKKSTALEVSRSYEVNLLIRYHPIPINSETLITQKPRVRELAPESRKKKPSTSFLESNITESILSPNIISSIPPINRNAIIRTRISLSSEDVIGVVGHIISSSHFILFTIFSLKVAFNIIGLVYVKARKNTHN